MMRSAATAVVVVLMILRTAAYPATTTEPTIGTTAPVCDSSSCNSDCNLIYGYTSEGCPMCMCYDPTICETVTCGVDEYCVENNECPGGWCYTCVSLYGTTADPTKDCPYLECGPDCANQITGSDGCPTCDCLPDEACQNVYCDPGYVCELHEVWCIMAPCDPHPTCVAVQDITSTTPNTRTTTRTTTPPCPIPPCARGCRLVPGPVEGCYIGCRCPHSTCKETTCDPGQVCVMKNDDCPDWKTTSCFLWPTCVPSTEPTAAPCRTLKCGPDCVPGEGSDGCPTCDCYPSPSCETVRCSAGNECQMVTRNCLRAPCSSGPQCVPIKSSCPLQKRCGKRCTYGLQEDENGCQLCKCLAEPSPEN